MMYVIYKTDGSIKKKILNEFIQQGSNNVKLFVAIENVTPLTYDLVANFVLPNERTEIVHSGVNSETVEIEGESYTGRTITFTNDVTLLKGVLRLNLSAVHRSVSEVATIVSFSTFFTVNEGVSSSDPILMTRAEYLNLISQIGQNVLNNEVIIKVDSIQQAGSASLWDVGQTFYAANEKKYYEVQFLDETGKRFVPVINFNKFSQASNLEDGEGNASLKVKGTGNYAYGDGSFVVGYSNETLETGLYCFVAGGNNTAEKSYSAIFGSNNISSGVAGFIGGANNKVTGNAGATFGEHCEAHRAAFASGIRAKALIHHSQAFGTDTYTSAFSEFVCGIGNDEENYDENKHPLFVVGNSQHDYESGEEITDEERSNAFVVYLDGTAELQVQGTGENSVVILKTLPFVKGSGINSAQSQKESSKGMGYGNTYYSLADDGITEQIGAVGEDSFMVGGNSLAYGQFAIAGGRGCIALGIRSFAVGTNNVAKGQNSVALNSGCYALGSESFAAGTESQALGNKSFTFGYKTKATGNYSFALGSNSESQSAYSIAVGTSCVSKANYSFAGGNGSETNGNGSFAWGYGLLTNRLGCAAFGSFNVGASTSLFEVGNGNSANARSTAFRVNADGSIQIGNTKLSESQLLRLLALLN